MDDKGGKPVPKDAKGGSKPKVGTGKIPMRVAVGVPTRVVARATKKS